MNNFGTLKRATMIDPLGGSPWSLKCTTPDRLGLRIFMYLYGLRPEGARDVYKGHIYIIKSPEKELLSFVAY